MNAKQLRDETQTLELKVKNLASRFDDADDDEFLTLFEEVDEKFDRVFDFELDGEDLINELKALRDMIGSLVNIMEAIEASVS